MQPATIRTPAGGVVVSGLLRPVVSLGSGVLVAASFEPVAMGWLAPVGLALLAIAIRGSAWRTAAANGAVFGTAFMGLLLWWMQPSVGTAAWVGLAGAEVIWIAAATSAMAAVSRLPGWPVWMAATWMTGELARSHWPFGGFPWGRVGYSVVDTPWSALLPLVGVTGTGFVQCLLATSLAWTLSRDDTPTQTWPRVAALATGVALTLAPAVWSPPPVAAGAVTVAVVQGAVPEEGNDVAAHHRQVTQNHVNATTNLASEADAGRVPAPDFVVWPENSTAVDPTTTPDIESEINTAAKAVGVPVLVGALTDAKAAQNLYNQGIVWSPSGGATQERYTKHHPVPFGEWIPFRDVLGRLSPRLAEVPRDMLPGRGSSPLTIAGTQVADALCFDVAYDDVIVPQVARGAELVVVQTSNASFIGTFQLDQQFAITRARALESRRAVVVASMNGISAVIGPDGRVTQRLPLRDTGVFTAEVPLVAALTPAVRLQIWWQSLPLALTALAVVLALFKVAGRRRQPVESDRPDRSDAAL